MTDYLLIIEPWTDNDYPVIYHDGLWWVVDDDGVEVEPVILH